MGGLLFFLKPIGRWNFADFRSAMETNYQPEDYRQPGKVHRLRGLLSGMPVYGL
jgi:hypothetical protein